VLAGFTGVFGKLITLNEGLLVWYRLFFIYAIVLAFLFFNEGKEVSSVHGLYLNVVICNTQITKIHPQDSIHHGIYKVISSPS